MIILLEGVPGSGKSYEAVVYHVLPALRRGRLVITNLPLQVNEFAKLDPGYVDLIELRQTAPGRGHVMFSRAEDYVTDWVGTDPATDMPLAPLFIIDEAHEAMPAKSTPESVIEWYAMHRHRTVDVVLMTQRYTALPRGIIDRLQNVIVLRNKKDIGLKDRYARAVFTKPGRSGEKLDESIRKYDPRYFPLYQSYSLGGTGVELGPSDIKPLWLHPKLMALYGLAFLALLFVAASAMLLSAFSGGTEPSRNSNAVSVMPQAAISAPVAPKAVTDLGISPAGSAYLGVSSGSDGPRFLFQVGEGQYREITGKDLVDAGYGVLRIEPCQLTLSRGTTPIRFNCK